MFVDMLNALNKMYCVQQKFLFLHAAQIFGANFWMHEDLRFVNTKDDFHSTLFLY